MRPINLREHWDSFSLFVRLEDADEADDASDVLYRFADRCRPGRAMQVCLSEFQQRKLGSGLSVCSAIVIVNLPGTTRQTFPVWQMFH